MTMLRLPLLLVLLTGTAHAAKPIPKQLPQVRGLALGEPTAKFMADFSEDEKESLQRGVRIFTVRANTLPIGVAGLRCDFLDGKLVYIEAQLDRTASDQQPWTSFAGAGIAQYGAPKSAAEVLGVNRLHAARLDESAAWSDRTCGMILGRDAGNPRGYLAALVDARYLAAATDALKATEARQAAEEMRAKEDAERQRVAATAEAKRQQAAKEAEAQRIREAAETAKQDLKAPVAVRFSPIPTIYATSTEHPLKVVVENKAGEAISEAPLSFKVIPSAVAMVTSGGDFRCITTGDAVVTASAGHASHDEAAHCRIVRTVRAPGGLRLFLGENDTAAPQGDVRDGKNNPIDVTPKITVADPSVVAVEGSQLRGLRVGTTKATLAAGDESASFDVDVIKKKESGTLQLNDGEKKVLQFPRGNFEVHVKVKTNAGLRLTWVGGGSDCGNVAETVTGITSACRFEDGGSAIIENPPGDTHEEGVIFKDQVKETRAAAEGVLIIYEIP